MFRRGHREQRILPERRVVDQRCVLARLDEVADSRFEAYRPIVRIDRVLAPGVRMQVVHDVTAPGDQHAGVAQRPQPLADFVMKVRCACLVDAEL
jgi:hypothetical protein